MREYMLLVYQYLKYQKGQGMVEYALILALISIAALAVMTPLGTQISTILTNVRTALTGGT